MKKFPKQHLVVLQVFVILFGEGKDQMLYPLQKIYDTHNIISRKLHMDKMGMTDFNDVLKMLEFYNFIRIDMNKKD